MFVFPNSLSISYKKKKKTKNHLTLSYLIYSWRKISGFLACTVPLELIPFNQVKERGALYSSLWPHCKDIQILSVLFLVIMERFY